MRFYSENFHLELLIPQYSLLRNFWVKTFANCVKEKHEEEKPGTAGFFLSVFNLMNAILGSGILGLSYAMAQLGILCFFIICGGVAALAFYAIILMLNMCKKTGAKVRIKTIYHKAKSSFLQHENVF